MSLSKAFLFVLPLILFSCALKSHKAEEPISKTDKNSTLVKIKLDKKEASSEGAAIEAFEKTCKTTSAVKFSKTTCQLRLLGEGKVTQVLGENYYQVEFDSTVPVTEKTEYEIKAK